MTTTTSVRFEVYEGNARDLPFQLRRKGIKGVWDVSTATSIVLEVTDPDGVDMTPIALADGGKANWALGVVIAPISVSDVTARIGTYAFAVTVTIAGEIITGGDGTIEVLDRPGFTAP